MQAKKLLRIEFSVNSSIIIFELVNGPANLSCMKPNASALFVMKLKTRTIATIFVLLVSNWFPTFFANGFLDICNFTLAFPFSRVI